MSDPNCLPAGDSRCFQWPNGEGIQRTDTRREKTWTGDCQREQKPWDLTRTNPRGEELTLCTGRPWPTQWLWWSNQNSCHLSPLPRSLPSLRCWLQERRRARRTRGTEQSWRMEARRRRKRLWWWREEVRRRLCWTWCHPQCLWPRRQQLHSHPSTPTTPSSAWTVERASAGRPGSSTTSGATTTSGRTAAPSAPRPSRAPLPFSTTNGNRRPMIHLEMNSVLLIAHLFKKWK